MNNSEENILDKPVLNSVQKFSLKEMITWWEKKRIIYIFVLASLIIYLNFEFWEYPMRKAYDLNGTIWHCVIYFFVANLCYSLGWLVGVINYYLFKSKGLKPSGRWIFFSLGTLFSLIYTDIYFTILYDVLFSD